MINAQIFQGAEDSPKIRPPVSTIDTSGNTSVDQRTTPINLKDAVTDNVIDGSTASTAGVSSVSRITSRSNLDHGSAAEAISRTVNGNAFLSPELISADPVVILSPVRTHDSWALSSSVESSYHYDSNLTRTSNASQELGDFYLHNGVGIDFRLGTPASPIAVQAAYDYTADFFNRLSGFNTYTHNIDFAARVGRSNVIFTPYLTGQFRSVKDPSARDSGRETYDYLEEGVRGETRFDPQLIHRYDFSHTAVTYRQRNLADFEIWNLSQKLNYYPFANSNFSTPAGLLTNVSLFPWLDLVRTSPAADFGVDQINEGFGGGFVLNRQISFETKVGWGEVRSHSPSIENGSFSGWRYLTTLDYRPLNILHFNLSYARVLSFTPTTVGRSVDRLDLLMEGPFTFGSKLAVTPAVEFLRTTSNDYLNHEYSNDISPSIKIGYKINSDLALFGKVQYGDTESTLSIVNTSQKVFQETVGITVTF